MKRYLIFMYARCYPDGGANDLIGSVDNYDEFLQIIESEYDDMDAYLVNILDLSTGKRYPGEEGSYRDNGDYDLRISDVYYKKVLKDIREEVFVPPSV